jgi:hypothetical protein
MLLLLGAGYLLYRYQQTAAQPVGLNPDGSGPLAVTANASGVTTGTQAQPVQTATTLPGSVTTSPAGIQLTANVISQFAANQGYPAPQALPFSTWSYFYTKMTGIAVPSGATLFPGTTLAVPGNQDGYSASQYVKLMQSAGMVDGNGYATQRALTSIASGLGGITKRPANVRRVGMGDGAGNVNTSYVRGAVQVRGLAPIHGWG